MRCDVRERVPSHPCEHSSGTSDWKTKTTRMAAHAYTCTIRHFLPAEGRRSGVREAGEGSEAGGAPSSVRSPLLAEAEDQLFFVGHVIDREEVEEDEEEPLRVAEVGEAREQEDED